MLLPSEKKKTLGAIRPNVGLEEFYCKCLHQLIDAMHRSTVYWLKAAWRKNTPELAQDAVPAQTLQRVIRVLSRKWQKNFNDASADLAKYFAEDIEKRSSGALRHILKKAGFTVQFKMTPEMRDVLHATISENVGLIRTIPQQYLQRVQGMVMRSVTTGRDLEQLTNDIDRLHKVTRKRAELIARDQNNKATSAMVRARQLALDIEEGIWQHSHAGKEPRPTHLHNDGKRFNLKTGWYDPAAKKHVLPGELVNCRCTWRPVIVGFS